MRLQIILLLLCTLIFSHAYAGEKDSQKSKKSGKETQTEQIKDSKNAAKETNGSAKSEEMRQRNAEKKKIKEEYKASGEKVKGKKPWWKFWSKESE